MVYQSNAGTSGDAGRLQRPREIAARLAARNVFVCLCVCVFVWEDVVVVVDVAVC